MKNKVYSPIKTGPTSAAGSTNKSRVHMNSGKSRNAKNTVKKEPPVYQHYLPVSSPYWVDAGALPSGLYLVTVRCIYGQSCPHDTIVIKLGVLYGSAAGQELQLLYRKDLPEGMMQYRADLTEFGFNKTIINGREVVFKETIWNTAIVLLEQDSNGNSEIVAITETDWSSPYDLPWD